MLDGLSAPGMVAHIDADRAVIGTDPTLYTACWVWHHLSRSKNHVFVRIPVENSEKCHIKVFVQREKKLRVPNYLLR